MPTTAEQLWVATQKLLSRPSEKTSAPTSPSLADLQGGLESSATLTGDLVVLQQRLRDEWR